MPVPDPEPPASSVNSGVSGSDGGAADSAGSDFVVAGSPLQGLVPGRECVQGAVPAAADLLHDVVLQVGQQQEPSVHEYSPSLNPWDALSVSSVAHTSCAQSADEPLARASDIAQSRPSANLEPGSVVRASSLLSSSGAGIDLGLAFGEAFGRVSDGGTSELVLPWETPLMKAIFSDDPGVSVCLSDRLPVMVGSVPPLPVHAQPVRAARPSGDSANCDISFAAQAIQPLRDEDVLSKQQRMIEQGVAKWRLVFGRYARDFNESAPDEDSILASLGTRSPHTILKRVNAVLAYLRWFDVFIEAGGSAFEEGAYWKYVKFLKKSGSAASCGNSFLAGIRFAKHVVGMDNLDNPSRRCEGGCEQLASTAAVVKQAEALAVRQLLKFHDLLHREGADAWDQAFCAYCLVCAYGRCRQSDMSWVDRVEWEVTEGDAEPGHEGYIVIYTRHHKTARATAKKALLLPIIISAASVDNRPWLPAARQAFERVGLKLCGGIGGPMFRPMSIDGECLCKRGVCASEVSAFIRLVLEVSPDASEDSPRFSSHSLKRTCLAFASKAGLSRFTRACLGRHVLATESSEALYSVDLGLPAVQELEELMMYIREGVFVPDAAKAFRWNWTFPPEPPEVWPSLDPAPEPVLLDPKPVCVEVKNEGEARTIGQEHVNEGGVGESPAPIEPALTSSSSGSSSESSSETAEVACKKPRVVGPSFLHRVFRENMLLCGRPLTGAYVDAPGAEELSNPVCRSCHKHLEDAQE